VTHIPEHHRSLRNLVLVLAAAAAIGLVFVGLTLGATSKTSVAPTNSTPPSISGSATQGTTLTANPGTWNGSAPISFQYQWLTCDASGANCKNIAGQTKKTYALQSSDVGNTVRVNVIAGNHDGSNTAQSDPTAKVAAATTSTSTTTTTTTTPAPSNGCPSQTTGVVPVTDLSGAASLLISQFQTNPGTILGSTKTFTLRVRVGSTCGPFVSGAIVYVTAVPYNQFTIPPEAKTDSNGYVTLTFDRLKGYPATSKQTSLVFFIRARKDGEDILAGISNRRLVSVPVNLRG
jgi:hypothetical protein